MPSSWRAREAKVTVIPGRRSGRDGRITEIRSGYTARSEIFSEERTAADSWAPAERITRVG